MNLSQILHITMNHKQLKKKLNCNFGIFLPLSYLNLFVIVWQEKYESF